MSRREPIDRLDRTLEAILAARGAFAPTVDRELTELLRIAQDLRELPHPAFRSRLRADLSEAIRPPQGQSQPERLKR